MGRCSRDAERDRQQDRMKASGRDPDQPDDDVHPRGA
jgi:hypothetical protein